ncbi:MAG: hypothetical protein Q9160_003244 [Pyrenula sp. 1 TL-2023]
MNPMASYRSFQQPGAQRSPAHSRRAPGPIGVGGPQGQPHPQAMQNQAYHAQRQREDAIQAQLAVRRARKPTDKNMPDGIDETVIGEGVQQYKKLRDTERKLDYAMSRKKLDILDSVTNSVRRLRTLRITISNTVENQPWQAKGLDADAFDFSSGEEATYRCKIEGRLLPDRPLVESDSDSDEEIDGDAKEKSTPEDGSLMPGTRQRFSHFFKSITVDFDRSRTMSTEPPPQVEWRKPELPSNVKPWPEAADFDCLEFQRKGDENMNITINLVKDEVPERYRLKPKLAEVLDIEEEDRPGIMMAIWHYVKANGLQEDEERRSIRCDDNLLAIFGQPRIYFPQIPKMLEQHYSLVPPVKLQYTIRVDPEFQASPMPTVYDIQVATEDPVRAKILNITRERSQTNTFRQIASLDDRLALIIQAISHSKAKHAFYTSFSKDPANFVKRWMSSQKRDLEVILGEAVRGGEDASGPEFQRGGDAGIWNSDVVREAVRFRTAVPGRTS